MFGGSPRSISAPARGSIKAGAKTAALPMSDLRENFMASLECFTPSASLCELLFGQEQLDSN
jgi:hypothetical protein